jgi:DNA-binding PadR family transcriptional regulator
VIELAILGLLREQDLHGYELKKRIADLPGGHTVVSFGSLYPALARLEAAGAVKGVEAHTGRTAVPLTGSLGGEVAAFLARRRAVPGGRNKKVYGLTELGEERLRELLEDPAVDDRTFRLKVAFCRYLSPAQRIELFTRRRSRLIEQLADSRGTRRRVGERLDAYLRSLRDHDTETAERDIAWLDRLIATEQAALHDPIDDPTRRGAETPAPPAPTTEGTTT